MTVTIQSTLLQRKNGQQNAPTREESRRTVKSNYQNHLVNLLVIHGGCTSWRSPHQIGTHQTYILRATISHLTVEISKPAQKCNVIYVKEYI